MIIFVLLKYKKYFSYSFPVSFSPCFNRTASSFLRNYFGYPVPILYVTCTQAIDTLF